MTPPISATTDNSKRSNNKAFEETHFQHAFAHQDENNFPLEENTWAQAFRDTSSTARKYKDNNNKEPLSATNQQQIISNDAWKVGPKAFDSPRTTMREPITVPNTTDHNARHALTAVDGQSNGFESPTRQEFTEESESAMAGRRSNRQLAVEPGQDISRQATTNDTRRNDQRAASIRAVSSPLPRKPTVSSPHIRQKQQSRGDNQSVQSQTSGTVPIGSDWQWEQNNDPDDQEQALFEQRLCDDIYGVAVRKINQNGKSNLRYVKCAIVDASELDIDSNGFSSSRSVSSRSRGFPRFRERSLDRSESREHEVQRTLMKGKKIKVLTWGKKKDVKIPLERFITVRKGKTTDRTRRNICPAARILSLITDDPHHPSLDIEAPTRLDRDKFARAFARFLSIPLEGDDVRSVRSEMTSQSAKHQKTPSQSSLAGIKQHSVASHHDASSVPFNTTNSQATRGSQKKVPFPVVTTADPPKQPGLPPMVSKSRPPTSLEPFDIPDPQISSLPSSTNVSHADPALSKNNSSVRGQSTVGIISERSQIAAPGVQVEQNDDASIVSSITGAGFDQEIVEELHNALNELRAELEDSRAEAARAVKVAEQAIQSAENSNSKDWNSTVTHKAAEAAALAQKKSAEAMAKARMAEERLEGERKAALIWRKQAEAAEEEAGHWQTRAAAAEVQRAAMAEALEAERKKAAALRSAVPTIPTSEGGKRDVLEATIERNRALEFELEVMRQSLNKKMSEVTALQECVSEIENNPEALKAIKKKKPGLLGKGTHSNDAASKALLPVGTISSSIDFDSFAAFEQSNGVNDSMISRSTDGGVSLPGSAKVWAEQASQALLDSQAEIDRLRMKLAVECSARRKLLHEVQDLRGTIRVYLRPRPASKGSPVISTPSKDVLLLHRERASFRQEGAANNTPLSFEFDGILSPDLDQQDIYDELEDVCLSAMDGFNVCIMTYGQSGAGKTYTLLGDVKYEGKENLVSISNFGVNLRAAKQMFSVLKHRKERYQDIVTFSVVEVCDERLCDLLAGTHIGEASGRPERLRKHNRKRNDSNDGSASQNSRPTKLEIKTNHNGETIVHGLLSVEVASFEDVYRVWKECLSKRATRLSEQGLDMAEHEAKTHVISTLRFHSTNLSTGVATQGKIQFVDLACSNVLPKRQTAVSKKASTPESILSGVGNNQDWKFAHRSMATLNEVVQARSQYQRSVPYRNSTLTHLLSDSLEADTKVVVVACISSDLKDLQETACTLKFSQKLRNVVIGKATRHTLAHT